MPDDDDLMDDELEEPIGDDPEEEFDEEDIETDLDDDIEGADLPVDLDDDLVADDETDPAVVEVPTRPERVKAAADDDDEDDEDEVDPDDVEEDLDTILRDRIAANTDDDDDEDEELVTDDRSDSGDRVSPRRPEEVSCTECFLLVRASQFSSKRRDCPGGLDISDCPMAATFGIAASR